MQTVKLRNPQYGFNSKTLIGSAVKYADDKTIYLSATKKYYSSSHPNGHHSSH